MKLVVDANIVFSLLIKEGITSEIFFNPLLNFYSPEYLFEEIQKYENEILEKTHRTKQEFQEIFHLIKTTAHMISHSQVESFIKQAESISPDPDDAIYFALALKLNCSIWSNDKRLKNQQVIKIFSTSDLKETL